MSQLSLVTLCLLFGISSVCASDKVQCKGPDNDPVDWFFVYKHPKFYGIKNEETSDGYNYITSVTVEEGWKTAVKGLGEKESMVARTLYPLYSKDARTFKTLLYNQHFPGFKKGNVYASMAKGAVMADAMGGFWLIHSLASFPHITSEADSLSTLRRPGGHIFLCISVRTNQIKHIVHHLVNVVANFYYKNLLAEDEKINNRIQRSNEQIIYSTDWLVFKTFSKGSCRNKDKNYDFFCDILSDKLHTDLYVRTNQRNDKDKIADGCKYPSVNKVKNIRSIKMTVELAMDSRELVSKVTRSDRSNWAISKNEGTNSRWIEQNYVCINDIDRTIVHMRTGGGAVCVQSEYIWKQFKLLIREGDLFSGENSFSEENLFPKDNIFSDENPSSEENLFTEEIPYLEGNLFPKEILCLEGNLFPKEIPCLKGNLFPEDITCLEGKLFPDGTLFSEEPLCPEENLFPQVNLFPEGTLFPEVIEDTTVFDFENTLDLTDFVNSRDSFNNLNIEDNCHLQ